MGSLAAMLPESIRQPLQRVKFNVRGVRYYGKGRLCPVCKKESRKFRAFGLIPREEAECIHCGALERHRMTWLYLTKRTDLFDGRPKKVLHVAPELCFQSRLQRRLGSSYVTADLSSPRASLKMDITDIKLPDGSFDAILCSHVLEHVHDDRLAMRELRRVLKPDGWALLLVPISADVTFEDPSIVDPREREKAFGQWDHVRRYGPDYVDRLREAGFKVAVTAPDDMVGAQDKLLMGLARGGDMYHCTK
jgi:SAM-dependent methyltransferase